VVRTRVEQAFRDCVRTSRKEERGDERVEQAFRPAVKADDSQALAAEANLATPILELL
jgi:hypothetical protein